jgi:type I restriction enzyme M protein
VLRDFSDEDVEKIAGTFRAWRCDSLTKNQEQGTKNSTAVYADVAGFCKSATTAEIASHGHVLTPGRYVGAEDIEDDGEPFEEKMTRLSAELAVQFAESARLEQAIRENLSQLGFALSTHSEEKM